MHLNAPECTPKSKQDLSKAIMQGRINQANGRLKAQRVGVKIGVIGDSLYLVATLPPKPESDKRTAYQQRIALGLKVNPANIQRAEREARKVGALLDCKEFSWEPYLRGKHKQPETVGDWIGRFEANFRSVVADITWETDYQEVFKRLPVDKPLTYELLRNAVAATEEDSRTRKRFCLTLGKLAKFAGIEGDFKALQGSYSATQVDPRTLPSDAEIVDWFFKIQNPSWRWAYGIMATFGLRNHEIFFLDISGLQNGEESIIVNDGKTRSRQVWAYYPEWIDTFNLRSPLLPAVTGKRHADYGDRVTHYLRVQAKLPFTPYNLRHCWAVRTILFGLPDALAAKQMGHSLQVHHQTYHHWIDARTHQQAHEVLKNRSDRPLPPEISSGQ